MACNWITFSSFRIIGLCLKYFINATGGALIDDHQYVISGRNIPSIDIINYDPESKTGFASYWHTQKDNMENIDRETLKAAGQTVLEVIYDKILIK